MQLLLTQHPILIRIKLTKNMLQNILLMRAAGHLDQLEADYLDRLFDFLDGKFGFCFVGVAPVRGDEFCEGLVVEDVQAEIVVEV